MSFAWEQLDRTKTNLYLAPISMFKDHDLVVDPDSRNQYILQGGMLIEVSEHSDHSDKMSEIGHKKFSKVSSTASVFDVLALQAQANLVILNELVCGGKITLVNMLKLSELNDSSDSETIQLVSNILMKKYK